MNNCLFCKIANKEKEADIVYENDNFVVFKDINPKAEVHLLVVPKKHIESVKTLKQQNKDLIAGLILTAKTIANQKNIEGYKLVVNVGEKGGQIVPHLHLHLLAGKSIEMP